MIEKFVNFFEAFADERLNFEKNVDDEGHEFLVSNIDEVDVDEALLLFIEKQGWADESDCPEFCNEVEEKKTSIVDNYNQLREREAQMEVDNYKPIWGEFWGTPCEIL